MINIKPLSQSRAIKLAELLHAVSAQRRCVWINIFDQELSGTMRGILDENYNGYRGDDVRGGYVRITTSTGGEILMSVEHVIDAMEVNEFFVQRS